MELEELSNLSKNDFLPLIPSIKQEQLDTSLTEMDTQDHLGGAAGSTAASTTSSSIVNSCDSAEKRVSSHGLQIVIGFQKIKNQNKTQMAIATTRKFTTRLIIIRVNNNNNNHHLTTCCLSL